MTVNADDVIIREIDAAAISPMSHAVTRNLYRHIPLLDALQTAVVSAFDETSQPQNKADLQHALWRKIEGLNPDRQGCFRLLVILTRPDEVIDQQLAEYMILWAREQWVTTLNRTAANHPITEVGRDRGGHRKPTGGKRPHCGHLALASSLGDEQDSDDHSIANLRRAFQRLHAADDGAHATSAGSSYSIPRHQFRRGSAALGRGARSRASSGRAIDRRCHAQIHSRVGDARWIFLQGGGR
jgi:hypothetical protein